MADPFLTRKFGPLPAWQWAALIGGGAGIVLYLVRARRGAAESGAATTPASLGAFDPAGPLPGATPLVTLIVQQGQASKPTGTTPTTAQKVRAFITGAEYNTLSAAQKRQWSPYTTAGGARGFIPKGNVTPELSQTQYRNLSPSNRQRFVKSPTRNVYVPKAA